MVNAHWLIFSHAIKLTLQSYVHFSSFCFFCYMYLCPLFSCIVLYIWRGPMISKVGTLLMCMQVLTILAQWVENQKSSKITNVWTKSNWCSVFHPWIPSYLNQSKITVPKSTYLTPLYHLCQHHYIWDGPSALLQSTLLIWTKPCMSLHHISPLSTLVHWGWTHCHLEHCTHLYKTMHALHHILFVNTNALGKLGDRPSALLTRCLEHCTHLYRTVSPPSYPLVNSWTLLSSEQNHVISIISSLSTQMHCGRMIW